MGNECTNRTSHLFDQDVRVNAWFNESPLKLTDEINGEKNDDTEAY